MKKIMLTMAILSVCMNQSTKVHAEGKKQNQHLDRHACVQGQSGISGTLIQINDISRDPEITKKNIPNFTGIREMKMYPDRIIIETDCNESTIILLNRKVTPESDK
jgi:hypothetical protein